MSGLRTPSTPLRAGLVSVLSVLYLALTVNALSCGLVHGLAAMGADCAMGEQGMAQMDRGDHPGTHVDKRLAKALCQCLDKVTAHGPVVAAVALAAPRAAEPADSRPAGALPQRPLGPSAPRAPPFLIS